MGVAVALEENPSSSSCSTSLLDCLDIGNGGFGCTVVVVVLDDYFEMHHGSGLLDDDIDPIEHC